MSENLNRDFSKYEAMTTEELEKILRLDAEVPAGTQTDTELLLFIMEVLASRRNTEKIAGNTAQKAWESFQQNYMPEEPAKPLKTNKSTVWMRKFFAAAAVVALLILIPVSSSALTMEEVWNILARWAKETFSFVSSENTEVSEPSPADQDTYSSLQELLQENNRDFTMVPVWFPSGFVLKTVKKDVSPVQEFYVAQYVNGDREIFIRIENHLVDDFLKIETNQTFSEVYSVGGQDYYIFNNNSQNQAIWVYSSYECTISGNLSIDEIKKMIDSIEKG